MCVLVKGQNTEYNNERGKNVGNSQNKIELSVKGVDDYIKQKKRLPFKKMQTSPQSKFIQIQYIKNILKSQGESDLGYPCSLDYFWQNYVKKLRLKNRRSKIGNLLDNGGDYCYVVPMFLVSCSALGVVGYVVGKVGGGAVFENL